jgi:hypothetical protein
VNSALFTDALPVRYSVMVMALLSLCLRFTFAFALIYERSVCAVLHYSVMVWRWGVVGWRWGVIGCVLGLVACNVSVEQHVIM